MKPSDRDTGGFYKGDVNAEFRGRGHSRSRYCSRMRTFTRKREAHSSSGPTDLLRDRGAEG